MSKHTKPAIAAKITQPRVFTIEGEEVTAIPGHYLVTYEDGELMLLNEDEFKSKFIRVPGSKSDEVLAIEDVNAFFRDHPNGLTTGQDTTDKDGKPLEATASQETLQGLKTVKDLLDTDHEASVASEAARADASLKVKEAREKAQNPKAAKETPATEEETGFGTSLDKPENESAAANTAVTKTKDVAPAPAPQAKAADVKVAPATDAKGSIKN